VTRVCLYCVHTSTSTNHGAQSHVRGQLNLREGGVEYTVGDTLDGAPTEHTLCISHSQDKWRMCAESKEELNKWHNLLRTFLDPRATVVTPAPLPAATPPARRPSTESTETLQATPRVLAKARIASAYVAPLLMSQGAALS
jgi:hypothetical protein